MNPDPAATTQPSLLAEPPASVAHTAPPPRSIPGTGEAGRHILVVLVMDKPGVLNRVASLMRARNFNIDSLAVSRTDKEHISRMTLTLHGDDVAVEQAAKQLYRLIDVLKVQDVTADSLVALVRGYGIKELVRTGAVVMLRGAGSIEEALKL